MNNYLCLSTSDIHGNVIQYEKIKKVVIEKNVSFVFFCGDLLPKTGGLWHPENKIRTIQLQKNFIENYLLSYLQELSKYTYIYAIFGNDDFKSNYGLLKKINSKVFFLENETSCLPIEEGIYISGYPYVLVTPFLQKDWEKLDYPDFFPDYKQFRLDGYASKNGKHFPVHLVNNAIYSSSITEDLQQLAKKSDPRKTIYLFHEPPYNTPLDMIIKDNPYIKDGMLHIGSKAVRNFIKRYQPLLTMHGHIHETYDASGDYQWRYKKSIAITAANNFMSDSVSYVLFSFPSRTNFKRVTI